MPLTDADIAQMDAASGIGGIPPDLMAQMDADAGLTPTQTQANPQDDGFFARVGRDANKRIGMMSDIQGATDRGEQSKFEGQLQLLGKGGAGILNDVAGEALTSGFRALPDAIENPIRSGAKSVSDYLGNFMVGRGASDAAHWVGDKYQNLSKEYPRAARNIEAVTDIGGLLAAGGIARSTGVADAAVSGAKNVAQGAKDLILSDEALPVVKKTLAQQVAEAKAQASNLYQAQKNIEFTPEQVTGLRDSVSKLAPTSDLALRDFNKAKASGHIQDILESTASQPLTFEGALSKRASINDDWVAAKNAGRANEARQLDDLKDALDQTMINPETGTWQEANKMFGIASTKQDFSNMVERAETMAQPANSLDKAIGNYLKGWRGKTLSPQERDVLEQITSRSYKTELRRGIAGRLTSATASGVGALVGGVPGAVIGDFIGTYASKFARDMAMKEKLGGLDEFFQKLDMRAMGNPKP